jgi:Holliday junction resolvasome RuvABC endonuclease subunit
MDIDTSTDNKAYSEGMNIVDYGYIDTHSIREEGKTLIYIEQRFASLVKQYKPEHIAAEQMFHGKNSQTGIVLAGIHAIMKLVAAKGNIDVTYYSIMTMKSTTLNGMKLKNADGTRKTGEEMKREVMDAVLDIFGKQTFYKDYTDDVTDAISAGITYVRHDGQGVGTQSADHKKKTSKKKAAEKKESVKNSVKESVKDSTKKSTTKKSTKDSAKKTTAKKTTTKKTAKEKVIKEDSNGRTKETKQKYSKKIKVKV